MWPRGTSIMHWLTQALPFADGSHLSTIILGSFHRLYSTPLSGSYACTLHSTSGRNVNIVYSAHVLFVYSTVS
jgi:hypothetical protein